MPGMTIEVRIDGPDSYNLTTMDNVETVKFITKGRDIELDFFKLAEITSRFDEAGHLVNFIYDDNIKQQYRLNSYLALSPQVQKLILNLLLLELDFSSQSPINTVQLSEKMTRIFFFNNQISLKQVSFINLKTALNWIRDDENPSENRYLRILNMMIGERKMGLTPNWDKRPAEVEDGELTSAKSANLLNEEEAEEEEEDQELLDLMTNKAPSFSATTRDGAKNPLLNLEPLKEVLDNIGVELERSDDPPPALTHDSFGNPLHDVNSYRGVRLFESKKHEHTDKAPKIVKKHHATV